MADDMRQYGTSTSETLLAALLASNGGFGGRGGYGYGYPGGYGHGHHDDDHYANLIQQIAKTSADIVQATQSQNIAAISATNAAAQAAQEIASETRSDVNRIEGAIELAQSQSESRLASALERNGGEDREAIERNGGEVRTAVERNGGEVRTAVERTSSEIRQNVSDGNAELRRDLADGQSLIRAALDSGFADVRHTNTMQHGLQILEIERAKHLTIESRAHLERQAAEHFARIQHEADRNKFELARQMAECCCELKEHVHGEGEKTRMLIEKNEIDRLREALERERREVDHHRHNEAVRVSVQQYVSQRQYGAPAPVAA